MRVLVACEFSGTVRDAFVKKGHDAMSCDLLPTDAPGKHHQGCVIELLNNTKNNYFDLIIAHPECTKLCVSGNAWYGEGKAKYQERLDAVKWTMMFWELSKLKAKSVCFENPVGVLSRLGGMVKASYVQPYQFGHKEQKKTGLHLHNLKPLTETNNVYNEMMLLPKKERERLHYLPPSKDRWKIRSMTYKGIAEAMAEQWGNTKTRT
jgi:hypothetical protein